MAAPPKQLTFKEVDAAFCTPGSYFEIEEVTIDGRPQRVWKNAPRTFRDFLVDRMTHWSDRVMVNEPNPLPGAHYDDRRDITYGQMLADGYRLAGWMREQGVGPATRVAIGGTNSIGWLTSFTAVNLLGAVPVCLNSTLVQDVQIHCLTLTKPHIVLVDSADAEVLGPVADKLAQAGVGKVYSWNPVSHLNAGAQKAVKYLDFANLPVSPQSVEAVRRGDGFNGVVEPESDGLILFTSGTTSLPKGVMITQRQNCQNIITGSAPIARVALRMGAPVAMAVAAATTPPEDQVSGLMSVPFFHVTGNISWNAMVRQGARMVMMRRWSVPDAIKLIVRYNIKNLGGVPSIATAILQSGKLPEDHQFDGVSYGGAAPPKRLVADVKKRFPNAFINHGWGMTEASGLHIAISGQDYIDRPEAVGIAIPIGEMRIVHLETREPVPPNTLGVLHIKGGNVMKGYINNPKANAEAFTPDGWFDTGDVGIMDADGILYLRDRAKDMIIRGGENIASAEVENAVTLDSRIAECAAVPVPDPVLGERVGLGVSLAPGVTATPESIIAEAEKRLRKPARPVIVVIFDELPRNANGKTLKNDVKDVVGKAWAAQGGKPAADSTLKAKL